MKIYKTTQTTNNQVAFNGLYKIKAPHDKIKELKSLIIKNDYDALVIRTKKHPQEKNTAFVLTNKTFDKFMDLIGKKYFRTLKNELPKYLKEEPKDISITDLKKKLKKGN